MQGAGTGVYQYDELEVEPPEGFEPPPPPPMEEELGAPSPFVEPAVAVEAPAKSV